MAYENVNVSSLKSALNKIDNINASQVEQLANSISEKNWSGNSRKAIINALNDISKEYQKISKYVEKCKTAADYIEKYQKLDNKNKNTQEKLDSKNNKYQSAKDDDKDSIKNDMDSYKNSISNNKSEMNNLKNKIDSLIK